MATFLSLLPSILQAAVAAINLIQQEQGKTPEQAAIDVISHLTPGAPNSTTLAPAPASSTTS
jgi:hypothetical protein